MAAIRLRIGPLVAAVGGVLVLIGLFAFDWYGRNEGLVITSPSPGVFTARIEALGNLGAWEHTQSLDTLANVVLIAAAAAAFLAALLAIARPRLRLPRLAIALTAALGVGALAAIVLRMVFPPATSSLEAGIFLTLAGAIVLTAGCCWWLLAALRKRADVEAPAPAPTTS